MQKGSIVQAIINLSWSNFRAIDLTTQIMFLCAQFLHAISRFTVSKKECVNNFRQDWSERLIHPIDGWMFAPNWKTCSGKSLYRCYFSASRFKFFIYLILFAAAILIRNEMRREMTDFSSSLDSREYYRERWWHFANPRVFPCQSSNDCH